MSISDFESIFFATEILEHSIPERIEIYNDLIRERIAERNFSSDFDEEIEFQINILGDDLDDDLDDDEFKKIVTKTYFAIWRDRDINIYCQMQNCSHSTMVSDANTVEDEDGFSQICCSECYYEHLQDKEKLEKENLQYKWENLRLEKTPDFIYENKFFVTILPEVTKLFEENGFELEHRSVNSRYFRNENGNTIRFSTHEVRLIPEIGAGSRWADSRFQVLTIDTELRSLPNREKEVILSDLQSLIDEINEENDDDD
jgi:hypothetical protein